MISTRSPSSCGGNGSGLRSRVRSIARSPPGSGCGPGSIFAGPSRPPMLRRGRTHLRVTLKDAPRWIGQSSKDGRKSSRRCAVKLPCGTWQSNRRTQVSFADGWGEYWTPAELRWADLVRLRFQRYARIRRQYCKCKVPQVRCSRRTSRRLAYWRRCRAAAPRGSDREAASDSWCCLPLAKRRFSGGCA